MQKIKLLKQINFLKQKKNESDSLSHPYIKEMVDKEAQTEQEEQDDQNIIIQEMADENEEKHSIYQNVSFINNEEIVEDHK